MLIRTLLTGIVCLGLVATSQARRIEKWSYQRLLETSDTVVIGTAVKTEEWDKPLAIPLFAEVLKGQRTTFKVEAVLKGKLSGTTLELLHCRIKTGPLIEDGPILAEFRQKGRKLKIVEVDGVAEMRMKHEGKPHYLLFLKARSDGMFEPVRGQVDSAFSVRLLSSGK